MDNGPHEKEAEEEMSLAERRRKKFDELIKESSVMPSNAYRQEDDERHQKALERKKEMRKRDFRKLMPLVLGIIIGGYVTRNLLSSVTGSGTATTITIITGVFSLVLMWWITISTYTPPGMHFTEVGHTESDNHRSMWQINDVQVPTNLIDVAHFDNPPHPIMRNGIQSNLAEAVEWDDVTGELSVTSPISEKLSELSMISGHLTMAMMKDLITQQSEYIQTLEAHMEYMIDVEVEKRVAAKLDLLGVRMFNPQVKEDAMTDMKTKMENAREKLNKLMYGFKNDDKNSLKMEIGGDEDGGQ